MTSVEDHNLVEDVTIATAAFTEALVQWEGKIKEKTVVVGIFFIDWPAEAEKRKFSDHLKKAQINVI